MSLSLHVLSILGAAGTVVVSNPQQPFPEVATWTPSKALPLAIAQMADKKIAALRRVECESIIDFQMPKRGGTGHSTNVSQIQDSKYFALEFLVISFKKQSEIESARIRSNGKKARWTQASFKKALTFPVGKVRVAANVKPEDWLMRHNRFVYGASLGETPFTDLITRAQKPGSGYQVKIDQRTVRRRNVPSPQYKISVVRLDSAAKKLGPVRVDAIIDATLGLPVTVASQGQLKGQEAITVVNNLRWKVRRKNFDLGTFTLQSTEGPKSMPAKKRG